MLNPVDIANLSFRPSYFFENEYWTLHKVMYSSSIYQPSKCEFLKLKAVPTPTVFTEELIGGLGTIGDEATPIMFEDSLSGNNVLNMKSSHVDGLNNFIDKSAMFVDIKGDSNKVFTDSKNITIHPRGKSIYEYLFNNKRIEDINYNSEILNIFSRDVLKKIKSCEIGTWEHMVPDGVAKIIKDKSLFGMSFKNK